MLHKTNFPRKYWWVVLIVVPIAAALIGLLAAFVQFIRPNQPPSGIYITNSRISSDMYFVTQEFNGGSTVGDQDISRQIELANAFVQAKNYADAIPLLEQVIAQSPSPAVHNNLGVLYSLLGNNQKAQESFQEALAQRQSDQPANLNLGILLQAQGNPEAASYLAKAPDLRAPEKTATSRPIAESSTQTPGLNAQLFEFMRNQNTITAKVRLLNSSSKDISFGYSNTGMLLDEATHKQYPVAEQNIPFGLSVTVPANGSIEIWAKFPVPAEDNPKFLSIILQNGILFERVVVQ